MMKFELTLRYLAEKSGIPVWIMGEKGLLACGVKEEYLADETAKGERREDVMNHFWEIDNKPVEDTLFWEQTGIDLSKLH